MLDLCPGEKTINNVFCNLYVAGVRNGASMEAAIQKRNPSMCFPAEATNEQLSMSLVKFLREHPENLHLPSQLVIYAMANKYYPCKKGQK